jgi:hypothetical protein
MKKIFNKQWTIGKLVAVLALVTFITVNAFTKWGWVPQENVDLILRSFYNDWHIWAIISWAILFCSFRLGGEKSYLKTHLEVEESIQLDKWAVQQATLIIIAITLIIICLRAANIFDIMYNASLSP